MGGHTKKRDNKKHVRFRVFRPPVVFIICWDEKKGVSRVSLCASGEIGRILPQSLPHLPPPYFANVQRTE